MERQERTILLVGFGLMFGLLGVMILLQESHRELAGLAWFVGLMIMLFALADEPLLSPPKK